MKQTIKLLISFAVGAITATAVLSFFLPARLVSSVPVLGEYSPQWSLESFSAINSEMSELVKDPNIAMAVIPHGDGNGYNVLAFDDRLRARFGITSWDDALERVHDRMNTVRKNEEKQSMGDTGAIPLFGQSDPIVVWHTLHKPGTHTHRELHFAENYGTYVYVDHTDYGNFPDLLHDCRGNYLHKEDRFVLQSPFGDDYTLELIEFDGLKCITPTGIALNDAIREGWLLTLKDMDKKQNKPALDNP